MAINVDIVGLIEAQAKSVALGYEFAYGSRPFLDYETTLKDLKNGTGIIKNNTLIGKWCCST